jgi:hypothetical protein
MVIPQGAIFIGFAIMFVYSARDTYYRFKGRPTPSSLVAIASAEDRLS